MDAFIEFENYNMSKISSLYTVEIYISKVSGYPPVTRLDCHEWKLRSQVIFKCGYNRIFGTSVMESISTPPGLYACLPILYPTQRPKNNRLLAIMGNGISLLVHPEVL
jgi:hypothetical protein